MNRYWIALIYLYLSIYPSISPFFYLYFYIYSSFSVFYVLVKFNVEICFLEITLWGTVKNWIINLVIGHQFSFLPRVFYHWSFTTIPTFHNKGHLAWQKMNSKWYICSNVNMKLTAKSQIILWYLIPQLSFMPRNDSISQPFYLFSLLKLSLYSMLWFRLHVTSMFDSFIKFCLYSFLISLR